MRNLKVLMILLTLIVSNETFAQQQKLVTIEMHNFNEKDPTLGGGGVASYSTFPFIIKTTDEYGNISRKLYNQNNRKEPIETFPLLREEIDFWLAKGYKLFSFNVIGDGGRANSYVVILTKEE